MESAEINWLAVLAAAAIQMVLGALWYSPVLFARPWLREVGRSEEELTGASLGYGIAAVGALLAALVLAHVVDWAEADGVLDGARVGLMVWVGFVAPVLAMNTYFGGRSRTLWAIDAGYPLVALPLMGALLGVWD